MSIRDKLRFEDTSDSISLQPNRRIVSSLLCYAVAVMITVVVLNLFVQQLGDGGRILCLSIIIYFILHGLYDILFRLHVRYIFDRYNRVVYRENPPFGRRKLMKFDEAVIFINADSGCWHYSLGIKKKQFLKNYKISPNYSKRKVCERESMEFEEEILDPLMHLLES
ncbi:hypothetical protein HMPREF0765_4631 [Sphingobacterium spiritivorum ATCC 33300]|uniref:Uncharacterized protein n=1 Tax=Sphingobacterium spiritivorum ATCC 33300 TaxID=525372 RepID=C2G4X5_SPHSI|nr:hypothetical protein [Sphingobacterium spiritivorum]EEI89726.1 hypothetical protein HMPREF0765_4631 [Sphingobacterium spiritivorum ATCC 33300]QQS94745.1 hypothetical protein I6J03_15315 [Sphingobacterium spiritivorum]